MSTHIATFRIDDSALPAPTPEGEQERNIAIFDLLDGNHFRLLGEAAPDGPYDVTLAPADRQLVFSVTAPDDSVTEIMLPFSAFRKRARAYFGVCESYFEAVRQSAPEQIRILDEERKALHNEGATILRDRLAEQVEIDENTSRRFFTLVCSLLYRG